MEGRVALIIVSLISVICLSGCLNQGNPPPNTVDIRDNSFHPATITVNAGTTVTWSNHDDSDESVTAVDGSFDSGNISTGYEYMHTFLRPGTYTYYSRAHPSMRGEVVVSSTSAYPNATSNATGGGQVAMNVTGSTIIELAAKNIAFDKKTITVPAGAKVTVNFDNQDSGIPHNFAVYETSAAQKPIFKGEIITGPKKTTYTFTAPSKPGTYFFRCDVHPTQMTGQFIVASSSSQSTSPQVGVPSKNATGQNATKGMGSIPNLVEIEKYTFNPLTITVPAGTTVIWRNLDPVPHTVTSAEGKFDSGNITSGESYSHVFKDPGSYDYYCRIHPYMKGKVIVV
jgi:plastocyanin